MRDLFYKTNVSLKDYCTIRIGGNAKALIVAETRGQLLEALSCDSKILIGKGSNVLFPDDGVDGLVVVNAVSDYSIAGETVRADAGLSLISLSRICRDNGLSGLEWASGVPGSVGGAVVMNAGAHGSCMSDVILDCEVLYGGTQVSLNNSQCGFSYRNSIFKSNGGVILSVELKMKRDKQQDIAERMRRYKALRAEKQPSGLSLGSVFKNADMPAGYYIEKSGLKGLSAGDLYVSEKHANFIINKGKGTAKDFLALTNTIKEEVYQKFAVKLEEEFILVRSSS